MALSHLILMVHIVLSWVFICQYNLINNNENAFYYGMRCNGIEKAEP